MSLAAESPSAPVPLSEPVRRMAEALQPQFGSRLLTAVGGLAAYAQSEGRHRLRAPDLVARAASVEEVQQLVRLAAQHRVPVVAYGAGTSLEGNAAAAHGGLVIDLASMDRIVEVRAGDLLCVVEPGVTREGLNAELRATGLFFPVDPGANATLCGMVATRASGTTAVRYGTMRENTLALQVVLADGRVIRTGTRARKSSAGYDLTHLFAGSEGTLGIITEATLRLHGAPESVLAGVWPFATLEGAVETVIALIQTGVSVARLELLDPAAIRACNAHAKLALPEQPTLFFELHGSPGQVAEQMETVEAIGAGFGGGDIARAVEPEARSRLWKARHEALPAARASVPGASVWVTDVCVPISSLAEAISACRRASPPRGCSPPSWATSATATSTSSSCCRRTTPRPGLGRGPSTPPWSSTRCRSAAPAPASTASAWASATPCCSSTAPTPSA
jgi:D-lactate dehydrogenase (cytochrome)